uniref:Uncharacterized protein n=1 Tax=Candidatus Kentrum sp. LFY TaxID=2126342 RepID=A0A450V1Y4_9GAMM|nr:MAG: hypothetical protein BECKLFY1418A_GA0070994_108811 [Candidatus Kentron sp. LFY]
MARRQFRFTNTRSCFIGSSTTFAKQFFDFANAADGKVHMMDRILPQSSTTAMIAPKGHYVPT